jgi:hypothetical protein
MLRTPSAFPLVSIQAAIAGALILLKTWDDFHQPVGRRVLNNNSLETLLTSYRKLVHILVHLIILFNKLFYFINYPLKSKNINI